MSAWHENYMEEKKIIDTLISSGFQVDRIMEQLDGDWVRFIPTKGEEEPLEIRLSTADARKYLGAVCIAQLR
ncbi:hypothetical protein [Marinicrinis lubricantis]|uniref:Signal transducing protein n=1 Tax=Marinicrinis lubricantis TaxID=2086470 RepID=A0ABW1ISK3_9BACL